MHEFDMNTTKKEQKVNNNNKRISHNTTATNNNQRNQNAKVISQTKTSTKAVGNTNVVLGVNSINKIDSNLSIVSTKSTVTKTNRNQVSANWNNVAGSLKSSRSIPSNKKLGK